MRMREWTPSIAFDACAVSRCSSASKTSVMSYREYQPPADLLAAVACVWDQQPRRSSRQLIVPDGCIDLIWLAERELVIAGADTGPRTVVLPADLRSTGVRLRPGAAGGFLGCPADAVRDSQVDAGLAVGLDTARLTDQLAVADPRERRRLLATVVRARRTRPDPLVEAAAGRLLTARVASVAFELGVSERHLHRRTLAAVGYAPKMLARVLRLRRLSRLENTALADRALAAGYASQAHMSDEVRRLTGLTARQYLA
jgi:AraC-like DNA-binding protein